MNPAVKQKTKGNHGFPDAKQFQHSLSVCSLGILILIHSFHQSKAVIWRPCTIPWEIAFPRLATVHPKESLIIREALQQGHVHYFYTFKTYVSATCSCYPERHCLQGTSRNTPFLSHLFMPQCCNSACFNCALSLLSSYHARIGLM